MLSIKSQLHELVLNAIVQQYGDTYSSINPLIARSSQTQFGDYQANFAMKLAGELKAAPREIAARVADAIDKTGLIISAEPSGPGFINLSLNTARLEMMLKTIERHPQLGFNTPEISERIVVDYGSANIAKEMHIGHLRSANIGDCLTRILEFAGHTVIRQNHLGDWGTQFGMLIQHIIETEWQISAQADPAALNHLYQQSKARFDADHDFKERAKQRVVLLQSGDETTLKSWAALVDLSKTYIHQIYQRLGLLLSREDDCGESFYNPRLAELCERLIHSHVAAHSNGALVIALEGFVDKEGNPLPFLIQKSDGGYLYATTDLAAVEYRVSELRADKIIYVVDARQKQHFQMLFAAAEKANLTRETTVLRHVWFGSILGQDRKPFKTRSGESIKLIDVIDEAMNRARDIVQNKNPELSTADKDHIAGTLSIAAIKYADLVNDVTKDYIFDWDKMLAFEGNTAPYLINAYVRIQAIFRRREAHPNESVTIESNSTYSLSDSAERALGIELLRFGEVIEMTMEDYAPHKLCHYLFELAGLFHHFYEHCPILKSTPEQQLSRLALCEITERVLKKGMQLLGINTLGKM